MKIRNVNYYVETKGEGEPLVLLHGFTGSTADWFPFVEEFSKASQVVLIDLIGHGKTEKPHDEARYQMEEVVEDLKEIFDQLGLEKVTLLGYSMGGRTALSFASIYPERVHKLILESSSPGLQTEEEREERRERDRMLANKIEQEGMEWFVGKWGNIPLFASQKRLPDAVKEMQTKQRLKNVPRGLANSLRGMGTGEQPSWWNELNTFNFPVFLLTGEEDEKFFTIAKKMKKLIPNAFHQVIDHAGHTIHLEEPKIFAKIVVDALKEHS
ncbi:2-succinyl-6-hydroxy-2,4-cyclohexadiene-1-carboxylate synthase [Bacillus tianshenii]|nr:2-succinyl-6-hydroxy-2,4-cyclohexadiene-1-carboxylate synthase [Bacillus tianshenii]